MLYIILISRTTEGKMKESKKIDKYLDLAREPKKNDDDTNCGRFTWISSQRLGEEI